MKNVIFIVEDAIFASDGYKSRIEMEMDILKKSFNFYILIPNNEKQVKFKNEVTVIRYDGFSSGVPFIFNTHAITHKLKEVVKTIDQPIIVGEALTSTVAVMNFCKEYNVPLIFDCHGTAPDEVYLYHKNIFGRLYKKWLTKKQDEVLKCCNLVITVSNKQYELFKYKPKHALLPMLPSEHFFDKKNYRKEIRELLDISADKVVFVYSGQNQKWQMSEDTIKYFKKIKEKNEKAFLLIYTNQVEEFENICCNLKLKDYLVKKVPYEYMPKYLDACDYGFCLRENNIINLVASPTKVLEYISRGVTPILTKYVGDYSSKLKEDGKAIIINDLEDIPSFSICPEKDINNNYYIEEYIQKMSNKYSIKMEAV